MADSRTDAADHREDVISLGEVQRIVGLQQPVDSLDQIADKSASLVMVCKSGHRAGMAMMALSMVGYTQVRNLAGGTNAWTTAELPVVK